MPRYSLAVLFAATAQFAAAAEVVETARPVPLTRPEMKQLLEDMKHREIRIPLPELTEADRQALGERADSYESRLRYHYLPANEASVFGGGNTRNRPADAPRTRPEATTTGTPVAAPARDFTRNADPNMTLSYPFKTRLFWIVSRTNNCQYCLGHQEQKLSAVGMSDDEIAALDSDWSRYPAAEQAAFAYTRKLTYEPHLITDAEVARLREHYTDLQILEMTMSVAGNNAINRWKEGAGIPQSHSGNMFFRRVEGAPAPRGPLPIETFLTPTTESFQKAQTTVAAVERDAATGRATTRAVSTRPALESRAEVEAALEAARHRTSRLPLLDEAATRAAMPDLKADQPVANWMRLMANFPNEARSRTPAILSLYDERGDLTLLQKAQVSWIIARQDRAWYAAGQIAQRLQDLGQNPDQIFALDGNWKDVSSADRALYQFAHHLAATPIALTDADVAAALAEHGPRKVVQLVNFVTSRAYFDRVTEAAGLPIDAAPSVATSSTTK